MRRTTAGLLALLAFLAFATPALAGAAAKFLPTGNRPGLAKVQKRGKLAVSRTGDQLRIKAYVPAKRNGVNGVEIHEVMRPAAPGRAERSEIKEAAKSFDLAAEIAVDQTWRRDLGADHMLKGALKRIGEDGRTDEVTVFERGIDGMARSLRVDTGPKRDRWTEYQDPRSQEAARRRIAGGTIGLGTTIQADKQGLKIRSIIPRSAAARAGLRKGDRPLSVDGQKLTAENWQKVMASKGEQPFRLDYVRKGETRTTTVTRAEMRWPLQAQRTREGMAVIRFNDGFTRGIAQEVHDALVKMDGKGPLKGIVLDLRNNGGGLVDEAQTLLNNLVEQGGLGVYKYGDGRKAVIEADGTARFGKVPVAVLINGGSASMGEHVPNVLKGLAATRRVVILGEPTYGKGLMQSTYNLPRGAFKISNATFANGNEVSTQGNPVRPDVSKADAIQRQKAKQPGKKVVDPVMREAIDQLARMQTPAR
jgi:C-terminal peptidase prc